MGLENNKYSGRAKEPVGSSLLSYGTWYVCSEVDNEDDGSKIEGLVEGLEEWVNNVRQKSDVEGLSYRNDAASFSSQSKQGRQIKAASGRVDTFG
jgi:hypothetical protein